MNGNIWEWNGGSRTVKGELQVLVNDNAADLDHSQAASSAQWKAIDATTGSYITPNGSGTTASSIKLDWVSGKITYSATITLRLTLLVIVLSQALPVRLLYQRQLRQC